MDITVINTINASINEKTLPSVSEKLDEARIIHDFVIAELLNPLNYDSWEITYEVDKINQAQPK